MTSTAILPRVMNLNRSSVALCRRLARTASGTLVVVGASSLTGWIFEVQFLKSLSANWPDMKPNTAVALLLSACALWLLTAPLHTITPRSRTWARVAIAGVILIGALTLAQHALAVDFGIDDVFIRAIGAAGVQWPGRMSALAAAELVVLGVALLMITGRARPSLAWTAQLLALLAAFGSFIALAGYLYGPEALDIAPFFASTALLTATSLLVLSVGVACAQPEQGFVALFNATSAGGTLLRRLLPSIVLLPVAVNWLELEGERRGFLPPRFGWMLDSALTVMLVGLLAWIVARIVHSKDLHREFAEAELRRSEEKYRHLIETSPVAIIVKDQRRIAFANPAALNLVGVANLREMLGKSPFTFVHPDSRASYEHGMCQVLQDGTPMLRREQRLLRMDGGIVDVDISATLVDYNGLRLAQVVATDVTERKRLEDALRTSLGRLDLLARATGDAVWDWDVVNDSTWWSDAFFEKFGYPRDLVPTFDAWLDHVHPEDRERAEAEFAEAVAHQRVAWTSEYRFRLADGSYGVVYDRVFGIRDAEGRLVRMVGSMVDVTELRHHEDQARLLSFAVASTSDLISITGLDDRFLFVNRAFLDAYGYTLDEVLGRTPEMLWPDRPESHAGYIGVRDGASTLGWSGELVNRRKDGTEFPIFLTASQVLDAQGRMVALMGVARDITERKRLDEELARHRDHLMELVDERTRELIEARELAEAANQAKSAFLATMSHEIRTPLNGVISMAEILALRPLSPRDLDAACMIQRSARNLLALIDDILDFSKIEAGKLELESAEMSLRDVVDNVAASLAPVAASSDVDLSFEVAPGVPAFVRGDATRVQQVLMNLAGNAIKFSGGRADIRGRVSVRLELASHRPPCVIARVADNGIGMSSATLGRLFTSFTQAETSTTRRFGGTGLGLAICKRLVELMAGTIEATSEEGRGSTFVVTLPFQATAQQGQAASGGDDTIPRRADRSRSERPIVEAAPLSVADARARGRLILVAEDDRMNQKVILQQLALLGYAGEIAADGDEALRFWRQGSYAMMLCDLHMPKMDGYEVVAAVRREEPPGVRLPIIALTANALRGESERAKSVGMDDYLTKPVPLVNLRETLERWIVPTL